MNSNDIIQEVLVRTGKSTTSAWVSETYLYNWLDQAHRWAAGYHKWPVTEGRVQTTFATGTGPDSDEWDFEGYKADSFRLMYIGGKRLEKLNYEDYRIFREEQPNGDDRVFSDVGGVVVINPNIDLSGTVTAWGQYMPTTFDKTDGTESTVFTEGNDEGNQAIIEEMIGYVYKRDGKKQESINQHAIAKQLLDELWQRILDEQYAYKTHPDRGGWMKRIDVLRGRGVDNDFFDIDQFN